MKLLISVNGRTYEINESGCITRKTLLQEQEKISSPELKAFFEKLKQNPFDHVKSGLYRFLKRCGLKIAKDGNFIGYKAVRRDFYDIHSGTIKYEVGTKVTIPLSECDPNPDVECSKGLHVGTLNYAKNYGGQDSIILEVEVDPRDVVAVPIADAEKLRCHSLYVRQVLKQPRTGSSKTDETKQEEKAEVIETKPEIMQELPLVVKIGKYEYQLEDVVSNKPKLKLKSTKWPQKVSSDLIKIGEKLYAGRDVRVVKIGDLYAIYKRSG